MIEKVNMYHPDKLCDRVSGAILDWIISQDENAKAAVEVMIGHGLCTVICESSVEVEKKVVKPIVERIVGKGLVIRLVWVPQDEHLAENQSKEIRCGDNGIFKGVPLTQEEIEIGVIAQNIAKKYPTDGKYILDHKSGKLIICQSCCDGESLKKELEENYPEYKVIVNPIGDWTGGTDVDTGCTNRKLGSDMGSAVTGGGLHGKDCSKADVSVNIYLYLEAQRTGKVQNAFCAIGDTEVSVNGTMIPFTEIVNVSKKFIKELGGYEELSSWGLW